MPFLNIEPSWTTAAAVVLTLYLLLYRLQTVKAHANEPPIIASAVPFVGHLLGMAIHGGRYIKGIGLRNTDKGIFTLPVPKSRLYIVTDPSLAAAVQRASKALSFTPLVPDITKRVLGLDDTTVAIVRQNLDPEPGEPRGFLADIHDMVYNYFGPGESLASLSLGAVRELSEEMHAHVQSGKFGDDGTGGEVVDLLVWIRHFVAMATASFLYGRSNPLSTSPALEQSFWDFDHGLGALLIGILPSVTARKPYLGREALTKAFTAYLERGGHKDASKIVQERVRIAEQYGWSTEAIAREEVSFLFAGIVNTATTTFWSVLQLFARPDLLASVRSELSSSGAVVTTAGEGKGWRRQLNLELVKNSCPTLAAVFRECLRVGSDNYSVRLVKTDTMLAGQWHLSANSVVQIAGGVMHADKGIWGPDAEQFRPSRFLKTASGASSGAEKGPGAVHPAAFRGFGGGKTLCPGRHFATNEILAFAAMLVLTFDLEAEDGGTVQVPDKDDGVLPVHILEPSKEVKVTVKLRDSRKIWVV
ncbi:cytochrome P450 [Thozetella sp. PMI_491]|nr:cytochrome P450 [Thozetella sp. PMI_491]